MRGRIEQGLVFVLAVQLDQAGRQILQRTGVHQRAVDERAAPALRRDLTPHQQLFSSAFEDGFDGGGILARPHEVAGGTAPKQQPDRLHQDRLACAGFAGQDVEARIELDFDRVDHGEVFDAKEREHVRKRELQS